MGFDSFMSLRSDFPALFSLLLIDFLTRKRDLPKSGVLKDSLVSDSQGAFELDGISVARGDSNMFGGWMQMNHLIYRARIVIEYWYPINKMKSPSKHIVAAVVAAAVFFGSAKLMAQQRGNFDPEQMRQRMMEFYQERLGMSGAEWGAVQPLLVSVMEKQRAASGGGGRGFAMFGRGRGGGGAGGGGGRGGEGGGRTRGGRGGGEPNPTAEALQAAIEGGDTVTIKAKLADYRASRKKAAAELQQARGKLRAVLNAKQEGQLVLMGMLD